MAAAAALPLAGPPGGVRTGAPSRSAGSSQRVSRSGSGDGSATGEAPKGAAGRPYVHGMPEQPLELLKKLMGHIKVAGFAHVMD